VDAFQVGYLGAKHLLDRGHRRIAFVNGPRDSAISKEKWRGFAAAVDHAGLSMEQMHVVYSTYTGQGGYEAAARLWSEGARPNAVFGGSDGITMGVVRFLYKQGLRIPDDISVIGYEESLLTSHSPIGLTVIDGHKAQLGEAACLAMLNRINKQNSQEVSLTLEPTLIERESVRDRRKKPK
jgi:DNA-binding LacI/PurR family transcriptional regulator